MLHNRYRSLLVPVTQTLIALCLASSVVSVYAASPVHDPTDNRPKAAQPRKNIASIIIDDVGNNYLYGTQVIALPAALTISILPRTTYARDLARLAARNHKEVMLHLPMQSVEHHNYSPGTLDLHMTQREFSQQLNRDLGSVPYIRGVNNHMGSLLTRHPGHMAWLMDELSRRGNLYFVDSKTTSKSIADQVAGEYHIPNLSRDFFLDPDDHPETLKKQFNRFIKKVKQRGYALAIAHPYPTTISFLKANIRRLQSSNIKLVPVSELIKHESTYQLSNKGGNHHVTCTGTTCPGL
jgi:polysaccharide deacetylase 2 family uncharacterized protein YibQ